MQAIQLHLGKFPIRITCYENGSVSFSRMGNLNTIIDQSETGIQTIISNEDIYIGANTVVEYGEMYDYKNEPELLAWLKSLNLEMPEFRMGF